ncbi:hypothetical protein BDK51DRAFT_35052 [Blyttiomyces helicus]|uniref:Uncharacterized protein n=1 Tax=Blyttiomyces helicus TaxID=388810 RepID=A0A4P9W788_9FUNG|nr:hypothetical protein BDK51DRAFT_35052 [Blyttiomyces helicus]|eukprot:RKO88321.1 hypothetical protein BDK51DRAFT_35052 [Blyttiomyces helicus]
MRVGKGEEPGVGDKPLGEKLAMEASGENDIWQCKRRPRKLSGGGTTMATLQAFLSRFLFMQTSPPAFLYSLSFPTSSALGAGYKQPHEKFDRRRGRMESRNWPRIGKHSRGPTRGARQTRTQCLASHAFPVDNYSKSGNSVLTSFAGSWLLLMRRGTSMRVASLFTSVEQFDFEFKDMKKDMEHTSDVVDLARIDGRQQASEQKPMYYRCAYCQT